MMLQRGEQLQLEILESAFEGTSVARKDNFVIFVEGGVPGDVVTVTIVKAKKSFAEARIVSIDKPSPLRVQPRCEHAGVCGGCKWQHVGYEAQLKFKQQHVVDAFERIGGFSTLPLLPIIGSAQQFFYRNKMEFSFSEQQWLVDKPVFENTQAAIPNSQSEMFLGLHVPQRYDKVLDIRACHLQSEISNRILTFTRDFARRSGLPAYSSRTDSGYWRFLVIRQSIRTNELMVNIVTFEDNAAMMTAYAEQLQKHVPDVTTVVNTINNKKAQVAFGDREKIYAGSGVIHERLGCFTFAISAGSFFQTNTMQAERLYDVAKTFAEFQPNDVVYDLYSGTGTIAIYISDTVQRVIGVESVESAIGDAKRNAEANGVTNCEFVLGDLKDRLTKDRDWMQTHSKPNVMIIDPPRSGMHAKVVEEILRIAPERIVYVSCNPATQARDVKLLCAEKYELRKLQPVDMFPHTYHIENVVQLSLR